MGSSNTIKFIAGALVLLAIVLAVVAFKMSRNFAESSQARAVAPASTDAQKTLAVVATKPLLANQAIPKDSVSLIPMDVVPKDYFANVDDVTGRVPLVDVDTGSPLTPHFFAETNQLIRLIPAGTRAVSVELNDVLGVSNFVKSGDVVDVLLFLKADSSNSIQPAQARILLRDALVLAYDEHITAAATDAKKDDANGSARPAPANTGRHVRTVTFAVPEAELTNFLLGSGMGELRLALHGSAPADAVASLPNSSAPLTAPPAPGSDGSVEKGYVQPDSDALAVSSQAVSAAMYWGTNQAYTTDSTAHRTPGPISKGRSAPREDGVEIYKGSKRETVYP